MGNEFADFVKDVEGQASAEELREIEAARTRFRIGSRLLRERVGAGMTQQQLAEASGVDQADISRIERGQANPTAETLDALARPLGITLELVSTGASPERGGG